MVLGTGSFLFLFNRRKDRYVVECVGRLTDLIIYVEVGGQKSKTFLSDFPYLLNDKKNKDIRGKERGNVGGLRR